MYSRRTKRTKIMTEGKYKVSGVMEFNEEEKKEQVAPNAMERFNEKGADTIETSINCDCVCKTSSLRNNKNENRFSRSNMIITSGGTRSKLNVFIATCSANIAAVAAGCVLTWSSPTIAKVTKHGERILVTIDQGAWLSSLVAVGASLGPFVASSVVNKIGRKWTIISDMFLFLASWSILAYCNLIYSLYFARILAGIAVGIVFTTVPLYVAEIAPMDLRGTLGSLMQFFLCLGFLMSYIIGPYTSYLTLIIICATIPLFCILTFIWVPESPHFLLNKNKQQEALDALQWFRGHQERILMQTEITDILASADDIKHNKGSIKTLFSEKGSRKALYYSCALAFFQQASGINAVLFYTETIFETTGSSLPSSISAIIIGIVMTLAAGIAAPAAKIFGVKNLLCFSAIGEAMSLAVLGFYFFLHNNRQNLNFLGLLPITSLIFFIVAYSVGFGPFVWVIMAEIFPGHLKAIASAVTASFCWFLCFIITRFFSVFTKSFGQPVAFWMFAIFCVLALIFVLFQLPDTEGKSFQEIQEMITGKKKSNFSDVRV